jgi:hypothetical protein
MGKSFLTLRENRCLRRIVLSLANFGIELIKTVKLTMCISWRMSTMVRRAMRFV